MTQEPGSKVLITEDCREGSPATGQIGVYEGDFPRGAIVFVPDGAKEFYYDEFVSGETCTIDGRSLVSIIPFWSPGGREEHPCGPGFLVTESVEPTPPYWFSSKNPRIKLPDGSVIWGDECWWGDAETAPDTLEKAQEDLEAQKVILRATAQAFREMSEGG